jgi:hypothetical protein
MATFEDLSHVDERIGDLPLVAIVVAVNGQRSLLNKPVVHREQAIGIPPAPDARAATVTHPAAIRGSWGSMI